MKTEPKGHFSVLTVRAGRRSLWKAIWQDKAEALKQFKYGGLVNLLKENNEK